MKFLVDECLHTSLARLAHGAGHVCDHVVFLGLSGSTDMQLMTRIREEDYTFVTNNRNDFIALYAGEDLHAGLILILPNVTPAVQRDLFRAALGEIGGRDLVNTVMEVDLSGTVITLREYSYPDRS
jgi:predicted nuclease of predicted toxin-antitoxin system